LAERDISEWAIFLIIEKMMQIKFIERGYWFLHASGIEENNEGRVYSSLHNGGKTQWVLKKIQEGAGFLGDDIVIADRKGYIYAYPRRVNIKKGRFISSEKKIYLIGLWIARYAFLFYPKAKSIIDARINAASIQRLRIKQIYNDVRIIEKVKLKEIIIGLEGEAWPLKRSVNFLINNVRMERASFFQKYLDAFWCYGDDISLDVKRYLRELMRKELVSLYRAAKDCAIQIKPVKKARGHF
jgi:hypothetical protein